MSFPTTTDGCRLPQELVDAILDILGGSGDVGTLKECAAVCAAWTSTAQKNIFRRIGLHAGKGANSSAQPQTRLRQIRVAFELSPHLAAYVKDFHLEAGRPGFVHVPPNNYIATNDDLPLVASKLHNLEHLHVSFGFCHWDDVRSSPLAASILHRNTLLTSIDLRDVHFPTFGHLVNLLTAVPALRDVSLHNITWASESPCSLEAPASAKLHNLALGLVGSCYTTLIDWLLTGGCNLDLGNLQALELRLDASKCAAATSNLVAHTSATLRSLMMEAFWSDTPPNLLTLRIPAVHLQVMYTMETIDWLKWLPSVITSPAWYIERVFLTLPWASMYRDDVFRVQEPLWHDLDAALSKSQSNLVLLQIEMERLCDRSMLGQNTRETVTLDDIASHFTLASHLVSFQYKYVSP
ncbi:hypothetical protein CYLTODRAFT_487481 [Cylindrobasidium torrendii FP15055 ss-10]|uniref:F-box domain-containing protein n=1 Tax=Cylindrobasidium torrendii FP15055 ss-10 TaxID=1314674 RepID=A0A0D7BNE3_9AGAR|nr:hypothetical protein CYLTODRAFT_487481 [Cylindrobasidium torrendii FP15055 ss-10]